jgi:hypothetical protein
MYSSKIAVLISEYDAGNRSPLLVLEVYTAIEQMVSYHGNKESKAIADSDFENEEALKNGIEWLRRKINAQHLHMT